MWKKGFIKVLGISYIQKVFFFQKAPNINFFDIFLTKSDGEIKQNVYYITICSTYRKPLAPLPTQFRNEWMVFFPPFSEKIPLKYFITLKAPLEVCY